MIDLWAERNSVFLTTVKTDFIIFRGWWGWYKCCISWPALYMRENFSYMFILMIGRTSFISYLWIVRSFWEVGTNPITISSSVWLSVRSLYLLQLGCPLMGILLTLQFLSRHFQRHTLFLKLLRMTSLYYLGIYTTNLPPFVFAPIVIYFWLSYPRYHIDLCKFTSPTQYFRFPGKHRQGKFPIKFTFAYL